MARGGRVAARALAAPALLLAVARAQLSGFNLSSCTPEGQSSSPALASGDVAFLCITFNGLSTAVFTPKVGGALAQLGFRPTRTLALPAAFPVPPPAPLPTRPVRFLRHVCAPAGRPILRDNVDRV